MILRESLSAILSREFEVEVCSSAREAMDLMARGSFHVVCSDWQMPGMDGLALVRAIAGRRDGTCCVLMSGHIEELREQVGWGDDKTLGFLPKPCDPRMVVQRIRHY